MKKLRQRAGIKLLIEKRIKSEWLKFRLGTSRSEEHGLKSLLRRTRRRKVFKCLAPFIMEVTFQGLEKDVPAVGMEMVGAPEQKERGREEG